MNHKRSIPCFQKTPLFEVSVSWRKIELLLIFNENVIKGKISICFLPWRGLRERSYSSHRFLSPWALWLPNRGIRLCSLANFSAFFASQHLKKLQLLISVFPWLIRGRLCSVLVWICTAERNRLEGQEIQCWVTGLLASFPSPWLWGPHWFSHHWEEERESI